MIGPVPPRRDPHAGRLRAAGDHRERVRAGAARPSSAAGLEGHEHVIGGGGIDPQTAVQLRCRRHRRPRLRRPDVAERPGGQRRADPRQRAQRARGGRRGHPCARRGRRAHRRRLRPAPRSAPSPPTPTAGSRSSCPDRVTTPSGSTRTRCPTTSSSATRPRPSWSVNVRPAERQILNYFLGESLRQTESRWDQLPQTIANGIKFGLIIAITAVGLSLIYGTTGLSNFAHGELVTLGAIVTWWMNQSVGLHILVAAPIGIARRPRWRGSSPRAGSGDPLRRRGVEPDVDDDRVDRRRARRPLPLPVHVRRPLAGLPAVRRAVGGRHRAVLADQARPRSRWRSAWSCCSPWRCSSSAAAQGKAIRAVSDNPELASATGINTNRVILLVWVAGGALAGLGGVLLGLDEQVRWNMGFTLLLLMFAAITVGGLGNPYGALVGALRHRPRRRAVDVDLPERRRAEEHRRPDHPHRRPARATPGPARAEGACRLMQWDLIFSNALYAAHRRQRHRLRARSPSGSTSTSATPACSTSARPASPPSAPTRSPCRSPSTTGRCGRRSR